MAMTYAKLGRLIAIKESRLSPASRTPAYCAFLSHMVALTAQECHEWQSSDVEVPADVVKFWLDAYREAEPSVPAAPDWRRTYAGLAMHAMIMTSESPWKDATLKEQYAMQADEAVVVADTMVAALAYKRSTAPRKDNP